MNVPFVDLSRQFEPILPDIQAAISSVIERCAFVNGPEIKEFEKRMAQWLNSSAVCAVSNCTHAIYLTLKALGIGEGDEVITVPNTAFPTSEAINLSGAEVVFADITPGFCTLDPKGAEQAITSKTKAIIPVHLYGQPADMEAIGAIISQINDELEDIGVYAAEDSASSMLATSWRRSFREKSFSSTRQLRMEQVQ